MSDFYVDTINLQKDTTMLEELASTVLSGSGKVTNIKNSLNGKIYKEVITSLDIISTNLKRSSNRIGELSDAGRLIVKKYNETEEIIGVNSTKNFTRGDLFEKIVQLLDDLILTDSEREELENELDTLLSGYTNVDAYGVERVDIYSMTDDERKQLIEIYEKLNKNYAKNMDECLEPLKAEGYDDDITYIKAIAYTAPEPYRTVYLENVGEIKILDLHHDKNKSQCYATTDVDGDGKNETGLLFNIDECWNSDIKKRYVTFFHESAHAIDDILDGDVGDGNNYTYSYTNENGERLTDALQQDVKEKIGEAVEQHMKDKGLSDFEELIVKTHITKAIMNCYDYRYDYPVMEDCSFMENDILSAEQMQYILDNTVVDVSSANSGPSSDIHGGYSGNLLAAKDKNGNLLYYHEAVRPDSNNIFYSYWVEGTDASTSTTFVPDTENGNVVYKNTQASEFWAENFAAQMTGNEFELNGINGRMDNGVEFLEGMIEAD